jgi:hypothetical protein
LITKDSRARAFYNARSQWLAEVRAPHKLSMRAKALAPVLAEFFNLRHFERTGKLIAWPSTRKLDKISGMSRNTVYAALKDLSASGHISVEQKYDPTLRRWRNNIYQAVSPPQPKRIVPPTCQDHDRVSSMTNPPPAQLREGG